MPLWNLLGGLARGYGDEGRYLDEQARQARLEALKRREMTAEAEYRDKSLAAEQEARRQNLEYQKLVLDQNQRNADREHEDRQASANREHEDRMARLNFERAEAGSKKKEEAERTKGWTGWQILMDRIREKTPWQPGETPEDYQARLDYMSNEAKALHPDLWKEHITKFPEQDSNQMVNELTSTLFRGAKTKQDAMKLWKQYKTGKGKKMSQVPGVEDSVAEYIDSNFPEAGTPRASLADLNDEPMLQRTAKPLAWALGTLARTYGHTRLPGVQVRRGNAYPADSSSYRYPGIPGNRFNLHQVDSLLELAPDEVPLDEDPRISALRR